MMRLKMLAIAAAMLVSPAASAQEQDIEVRLAGEVSQAIDAVTGGEAERALDMVDAALGDFERLYPNGTRYHCESEDESVVGIRSDGITSIPNAYCYALWVKGFALVELERIPEAVEPLERAVAMMPEKANFISELGYVHQALKHWDDSIRYYRQAAAAAEGLPAGDSRNHELRRAWFGIAYSLIEKGDLDGAEALLRKCLEVAPGDEKVLSELEYVDEQRKARVARPASRAVRG